MEYKFILWGYGVRGKRFLQICPHKHILAVIDQAEKTEINGDIPVIKYENYIEKYKDYDILIAIENHEEIEKQLEADGILNYFLMEDCPPEIFGLCGNVWINTLPIEIKPEEKYVIYGLNLFSMLLRKYIADSYGVNIDIIPEQQFEKRNNAFTEKYKFITKREIRSDEVVLWSSKSSYGTYDYGFRIQENFDFINRIQKYRNEDLKKYKNMNKGQKCFIVATGPSLRVNDLNVLMEHQCKCFGVNRIYLSFNETKWRPDYFVVIDGKMIQTYADDIRDCDAGIKFIGDGSQGFWEQDNERINRIHDHKLDYYPDCPRFSEDIVSGTYSANTVVYTCIQIAVYMGFEEIYIIGADHNYASNQSDVSNHFHKDYYKDMNRPNLFLQEKVELAFKSAKNYADKHSIKIYNATRGGRLEIFERVDFDKLFKAEVEVFER